MPPWVARQWHAWGCSRSVSGDLCRIQRFGGPIKLRFYAQSSVRDVAKAQFRKVNSAIIVPSSVANTRPEDLIAHIKPVLRQRVTRDRFAVFFVTPSFATWLLDDQDFLQKALRRAYAHLLDRNETPYARIHALCAVVDKLPESRPIGNIDNLKEENLQRIQYPAVQETGHEGIAYATLRPSASLPTSSSVGPDKAAISFVASEQSDHNGGHFSDSIRLPLANTVFQTGSPTMMTYSTWEKAKGSQDFTLKEKRNISHHGIRMQAENNIQSTVLSVPLVPLSKPRQVEASMGNILRRVTGPNGQSITASQELEQHVPKYFSARGEPSQATTVWALVMGPEKTLEANPETCFFLQRTQASEGSNDLQDQSEAKLWENLWKQDPPSWTPSVPVALKSGARLHRVLSGGGGWGKKAGLLSLDPIPTMEANSADGLSDFDENGPNLDSALQQVARPGDWIQFFISPSVPVKGEAIADSHDGKQVWGLELGTIPSTTDAMPVVPGEAETAGGNKISVFKSTFGALAEEGMVISRSFKLDQGNSFSTIGSSTVDVPFSRFSALNWRTESSPEEDVNSFRDFHESKPFHYHHALAKTFYGETMPQFLGLDDSIVDGCLKPGDADPKTSQEDGDAIGLMTAGQKPPTQTTLMGERTQISIAHVSPSPRQNAEGATGTRRIPNNINRPEQPAKAPVSEQPLIRFYKIDAPPRDELAYCTDGLRRVDRKVARYVREYRELINQIRRQSGLRMDLALRQPKPKKKPLSPKFILLMRAMLSDSTKEVEDLTYRYHEVMAALREQRDDIPVLIRKVVSDIPRGLISWLESATDKSAHWVGMYEMDFEGVMATISMNKVYRDGLGNTILVPVGAPRGGGDNSYDTGILHLTNVRLTPRRLLAGLSETTRQMQIIIDGLQDRIHLTLQRTVVAIRANEIFETAAALANTLSDILTGISFRAHMALDVNNSAVDIYTLHMHLRWTLTSLIMTRRGRQSRGQKHGRALRTLAKFKRKYVQLCSFNENLFVGRNELTGVIRNLLRAKEMENRLSRRKMIREGKYVPGEGRFSANARKKKTGEMEVRKMDGQYNAVKSLEDMVMGWLR